MIQACKLWVTDLQLEPFALIAACSRMHHNKEAVLLHFFPLTSVHTGIKHLPIHVSHAQRCITKQRADWPIQLDLLSSFVNARCLDAWHIQKQEQECLIRS